jgi:hypothetical protein
MYVCYQVRVAYSRQAWVNGSAVDEFDAEDWVELTRFDEKENATMSDTPLLVNIKGCGYPPDINCAGFARRYVLKWALITGASRLELDNYYIKCSNPI